MKLSKIITLKTAGKNENTNYPWQKIPQLFPNHFELPDLSRFPDYPEKWQPCY